ncbi:MAG: hypothetical protein B0W54_10550 [Cellvibrio sp. 79]|nr:MAG: hypothetical protein B0W54_10550 [Cellvibrio sp. 79]
MIKNRNGEIDLCSNSGDSECINLVATSIAGPSSMKFTLITQFVPPLASTLLAFALVTVQPASAEPDFLDGDMGLASSTPGNSMIDSSSINNDTQPPKITPAQAADLVRRSTGGQVMGVNSQHTETGVIYGVKVLNSGRMKVVRVDGQTGQIISQ